MGKLSAIVTSVMAIDPGADALEFEGKWTSWGELTEIVDSIHAIFTARDIAPGTRIGGILANRPEVAGAIIATVVSDRCIVTLNPALPDEKLAADIDELKIPVVFARKEDWNRPSVADAIARSGALGIELTGESVEPVRVRQEMTGSDFRSDADGICIEMLTSGTTGKPKRIPLPAKNFERMTLGAAVFENRDADASPKLSNSVTILNTPFSHIGGIFSLFLTLTAGRKGCMLDRFRVPEFVDAVRRHRVKVAGATPAALRMILDAGVEPEDLSSLKAFRVSTAPLPDELAIEFEEKYGIPVLQNYGATEFAGGVAGWDLKDYLATGKQRRGSVGKMNPGVEGRIVDQDSGEPLPYGQTGILELRGKALGNGKDWVRTTDLARMDEEQFLWILGRADNAIIRGGFKVFPDDVVKVLESHPAVLEACVVALKDPRLGEVPAAGYITRSGENVSPDELRAYLRDRLTAYQVPVKLLKVDDFPRTPSMKPSQPELRKLMEAENA